MTFTTERSAVPLRVLRRAGRRDDVPCETSRARKLNEYSVSLVASESLRGAVVRRAASRHNRELMNCDEGLQAISAGYQ